MCVGRAYYSTNTIYTYLQGPFLLPLCYAPNYAPYYASNYAPNYAPYYAPNYALYYAPNKDFAKQRFFCNFAEKESIINITALKRIKITVKRITEYRDLMAEYENPISHACDMHLGQCFIVENCTKPEGMCQSAWETLLPFVRELAEGGGNFFDGWMKNPHSAMLSCNDGFRPVSFLVETIE